MGRDDAGVVTLGDVGSTMERADAVCVCVLINCGTGILSGKYGVATISRIDTIIGLFCRILSLLKVFFCKRDL